MMCKAKINNGLLLLSVVVWYSIQYQDLSIHIVQTCNQDSRGEGGKGAGWRRHSQIMWCDPYTKLS